MSKIYKIILLLPSIKTGGGNRVMIELANELVNRNILVDIIYPNNSFEINTFVSSKKINFLPIGAQNDNKLHKLFNLLKVFRYV
ncbi:MAG: hypothetical protein L0Y61_07790, partial [Epsilonproteobacteria bacterium]|nr:hypothetical protein [Campylobacterota bacterium]